eukprot:symbB.v1.2.041724.t1/scaffold8555.1/size5904/2
MNGYGAINRLCPQVLGLKVKLPQCGSNFTTSWLPCEVKSFVQMMIKLGCFVHMTLKHRPPGKYRKEKSHSFALCLHGMVHVDEGHKLLERTLDLLSAACPLIKTGDKLACQN